MLTVSTIANFYTAIAADPRINARHISVYFALVFLYKGEGGIFYALDKVAVMQVAKINSRVTYHKCMQELHEYHHIIYVPSFDPKGRSSFAFGTEREKKYYGKGFDTLAR